MPRRGLSEVAPVVIDGVEMVDPYGHPMNGAVVGLYDDPLVGFSEESASGRFHTTFIDPEEAGGGVRFQLLFDRMTMAQRATLLTLASSGSAFDVTIPTLTGSQWDGRAKFDRTANERPISFASDHPHYGGLLRDARLNLRTVEGAWEAIP